MASKITVRALEIHWIRLKRLPEVSSIASGKKRFGSPSFFCTKCRTGGHKCKVSLAPCGTSLHSRPCIFLSAPEIEHATQSATLCSKIVESGTYHNHWFWQNHQSSQLQMVIASRYKSQLVLRYMVANLSYLTVICSFCDFAHFIPFKLRTCSKRIEKEYFTRNLETLATNIICTVYIYCLFIYIWQYIWQHDVLTAKQSQINANNL